jgi:lipoate-protein ligase B
MINELMKQTLDMGTMISTDDAKLRAYKEQVKKAFRSRWFNLAEALEHFELIEPCGCKETDFCKVCGGSRYRLSAWLSPDEMQEISIAIVGDVDSETADKLQKGLLKALDEVDSAMPKM